jgi:hypothetical protein
MLSMPCNQANGVKALDTVERNLARQASISLVARLFRLRSAIVPHHFNLKIIYATRLAVIGFPENNLPRGDMDYADFMTAGFCHAFGSHHRCHGAVHQRQQLNACPGQQGPKHGV